MPDFAEVRLPTDISFGSQGGPEYSTDVVILATGREQRNQNWEESRARFDISYGVKTPTQLATLITFFRARRGVFQGFRFKDKADFSATAQNLGTGNGTTTAFQLIKRYLSGSDTYIRTITKPVSGTVKIYKDGILQGSGWTVNTTTGVVTFTVAPANGVVVTADFEFDVPVRFNVDHLPTQFDLFEIGSAPVIELVEIRV